MRRGRSTFSSVGFTLVLGACGQPAQEASSSPGNTGIDSNRDSQAAWVTTNSEGPTSRCQRHVDSPSRTFLEQPCGSQLAVLTDGAHTVRLIAGERMFSEASAAAAVTTKDWVRVMPTAFAGVVNARVKDWILDAARDQRPDLLALSMQYLEGAPVIREGEQQIAGDADYGPLTATGMRTEGSDFYDYLGVTWKFPDGITERPNASSIRSLDCSGFVRMLFGLRSGIPMTSSAATTTAMGLRRRAVQMEAGPFGITIDPDPLIADGLQAGDLVFFDADAMDGPAIDHVGVYLGRDANGLRRFISSRKSANGPTMGDFRGASLLDGPGLYAKSFRSARRL